MVEPGTTGLTRDEATRRLEEHGPNALPRARPTSLATRLLGQFRSPLVSILVFALAFEASVWLYEGARGVPLESIAIAVTLLLNAALGAVQEHRSDAALARLNALGAPSTWVIRDSRARRVSAHELVPGDLIRLEAGDRVPADSKLAGRASLLVDESLLTGESVPVEKAGHDALHSGTLVVRGHALAEVTRTGIHSAMGRLAHLLAGLELGQTPLERRLDTLGRQISVGVLLLGLLLVAVGVLAEGASHLPALVILAVALAVAAVPEELPAVLTLTLALGVERMAEKKALVRRLSAVEALGSVTVIATDKTGTLTENRLRVHALDAPDEARALRTMVLANDADLASQAGDPLDLALLERAQTDGVDPARVRAASPRKAQTPFDSAWRFMRVTVEAEGGARSHLKGAPEAILARSRLDQAERGSWTQRAEAHAAKGHKVLGLASVPGEREDALEFEGLVALWDPPRPEVPDAIRRAQAAGIRVVMVTGDHPSTARSVARAVGLPEPRVLTGDQLDALPAAARREALRTTNVLARASPEHKLQLVTALQEEGEIVAMTGDGVNDAPALKRADVGVAMGQRGSDVTREVASIVLLDDHFATIVAAVEEGRSLYENIQKFMRFMFSTSLGFLLLVLGGAVGSYALGLRMEDGELLLPLTALQILWINFLADGPPAFALGVDKNPGVLERAPRDPAAPLLDAPSVRFILASAVLKAGIGLAMLVALPAIGYPLLATQAAVFAYEFLAQLAFAHPARRVGVPPRPNPVLRATLLVGLLVQLAIFLVTPLREALQLDAIDLRLAALVLLIVAATYGLAEATARWSRRARARTPPIAENQALL